jgi:hypothetical protein
MIRTMKIKLGILRNVTVALYLSSIVPWAGMLKILKENIA